MTYKEKLQKEHPEAIDNRWLGGCYGCPSTYGYSQDNSKDCAVKPEDCEKCWNQEIPRKDGWIPVSERLPEEHKSIFAQFKNTSKWNSHMWEKASDEVLVTIEYESGEKLTCVKRTKDGQWAEQDQGKWKVIAWKPFPEPYKGVEDIPGAESKASFYGMGPCVD